ncbi:protein SHOOT GRAVITROPISM 5-like [Senna tora]|uniref:Protein SHOOT GRAVITROPISM 5-like n=1 Tax=Senna tora TaxID=362788 RepID=A0A834TCR0_9FABA|nr:protein SHOOT GRAVITROPISM 5-like [Senna tora]
MGTDPDAEVVRKPTCFHHHLCHALGDLVGIKNKNHFPRKHSNRNQWLCGLSVASNPTRCILIHNNKSG